MSARESTPAPHGADARTDIGVERPERRAIRKPRRDALTRVRHDLRSLTHAVRGYADLLAAESHGPLNGSQQGFLAHVRSAALELERLVEMCVELSRPDGAAASERTQLALGLLVTRVQRRLRAQELTCEVRFDLSSDLVVETDAELLVEGLCELAAIVADDGPRACALSAGQHEGKLWLGLCRLDATDREANESPDALEDELSNRQFVRLRFAESLLRRAGFRLTVDRERSCARCEQLDSRG